MKTGMLLLLICSWLIRGDLPIEGDYILSAGYEVSVHGTYSIHSWSETIQKVSGELVGAPNGDGSEAIQSIRMVMDVRSINGDMGSVMNNKTYKALKGDADPEITFLLADPVTLRQIVEGNKAVAVKGSLTLAGVTRSVMLSITCFKAAPGKMKIDGEQKIKLTDFGVKPPSALFGIMRASPDITINFKTVFTIQPK